MRTLSIRAWGAALPALAALVGATSTSAGTVSAELLDAKDAPAYVSACAIDTDGSGVFTPTITVTDRKPSAVVTADVAVYFVDAQNRLVGEVVVSPPYGPTGIPPGTVERIGCRIKHAQFVDGSIFELKEGPGGASSLVPAGAAILGVGGAALLLTTGHGSGSAGATAVPTSVASSVGSSPQPVASIVTLARPKGPPGPPKPH